jgi:glucan 1,3-beta-glucosidase
LTYSSRLIGIGDGITDDTQAIQNAISVGNRCVPYSGCQSTTTTPALIYFPGGTYLVSRSIADYYMTHLMGNPNNMPILKATSNFNGFAIIEGAGFGSVNTFYRQVRNLVLDISAIAPGTSAAGIDWPTAQATSIQNCVFIMSDAPGTQHQGINIGSGSGGFLGDLVFEGGNQAVYFANQQFTVRNMTISNAVTAITHGWDWGWTYKTISIRNCSVGLDISSQSCGSAILIDSSITDTLVGIKTSGNPGTSSFTRGSIIVENVDFTNVATAVGDMWGNTLMAGTTGTMTVDAWGSGHEYSPNGPVFFNGPYTPFPRPPSLLSGGSYYERSKPTYGSTPASAILSVRSAGAAGNGVTDDTAAINQALQTAVADGQILFFDAGTYKVTGTIYFPGGSRVVGEAYPVIMGSGTFFSDVDNPQPVVRVGNSGESGVVEWSDMIVSTQGATAGAVLIEWNIASSASAPSGMWDVHTRIGGFAGSNLQLANCPTSQAPNTVPTPDCIAAFMSMHVTASASGLYMENVWLWTADHDIDDPNLTQISIYAGRGIYIESEAGNIWLVGAAAEHHVLYQYQLASTANVFMGQIQTETPYFQPNPSALSPFAPVASINDPDFNIFCSGKAGNCELAWAVRILGSESIMIYGAGLYSFFSNYETSKSSSYHSPSGSLVTTQY